MKKEYKTEFHVHTRYSKDSCLNYLMLLLMLKIKKIDTIVITDHNEIKGALKYQKKLQKHHINVIVGEEIFTTKGEIIGLNLNKRIQEGLTPLQTIKEIKKQNGIVYIPHPYDEKRYKSVLKEEEIKKNREYIDLIEIHNGRNISKDFSYKQNKIAEKYKIKKIIGSDAHTFFEIGRNIIITKEKITDKNILTEYQFVKKDCLKFSHTCTKFIKLIKVILRGDFNGIYRIINRRFKRNNKKTI